MNIRLATCSLAALAVLSVLPSCVIPRSYPNQGYHAAAPTVVSVTKPTVVTVAVDGSVNGKASKLASRAFKKSIEKALSQISNIRVGPGGGELNVAKNFGDTQDAAKKGAASGLTMGIIGVEVVDNYELSFTYSRTGKAPFRKSYKHAVHSIIGASKSPPAGVTTTGLLTAFDTVVGDLVKSFVRDLAQSGQL